MIGYLKGNLISVATTSILLDVQGVGYQVYMPARHLYSMERGTPLELFIATIVREDFIHLYGFLSLTELDLFHLLIQVQGVGMKVGLAILSHLSVTDIIRAIQNEDKATLMRAEGVGGKLAQRLIYELKSKPALYTLSYDELSPSPYPSHGVRELESALTNLGYKKAEFSRIIQDIDPNQPFDGQLKEALRKLAG